MNKRIKHISFLFKGERHIVKSTLKGSFYLKASYSSGRSKARSSSLSARELVTHPVVKFGDPVLNLDTGDKLRVYVSGDSSSMVVEASSAIDLHDEQAKERQEKKKRSTPTQKRRVIKTPPIYDFSDFEQW